MATAQKRKSGLGRGLDALLGDSPRAEASASPREVQRTGDAAGAGPSLLPIEYLTPNPDQPRRIFNDDAINELASSLKARGMLQPILVRPRDHNVYEIVAGERRWRAAQRAQLHEVPVIIRNLTDEQTAEIALIENVQRVDLNPAEEAEAYQRLADVYGRTHEQIAKAVGKSRSHVANLMRLLGLPPKAMEALKSGDISMGHARALLAAPEPDSALEAVLGRAMSVRETEKFVQGLADSPAKAKKPASEAPKPAPTAAASITKDADTRALESDLAAALGLEVAIDHSKKGSGVLSIRYLTLDQLDDVCRRLMQSGV